MRDSFGQGINITIYGESHGPAIGAVVQGVAPGVKIDTDFMNSQMDKRRAKGGISTPRTEADKVEILSGVYNGCATGTAITLQISNTNTKSGDYDNTKQLLRPGHADYTAFAKYHGFQDIRGGGHFSGRLTAPVVAGGSIFAKILQNKGVVIASHILQCGGVHDDQFSTDPTTLQKQLNHLNSVDFAVLNQSKQQEMTDVITTASKNGDSVGGILETVIYGLPAGLGEPFFGSLESVLSQLIFSIPAVKGLEFGAGFAFASMTGSVANDPLNITDGKVTTTTNYNGGINGGITNGMPVVLRTVFKPTPSIFKTQNTIDYKSKENATLEIKGRHDPCIIHRARVVQDSMCALAIAELANLTFGTKWQEVQSWNMD